MYPSSRQNHQAGFSLIEMLVAITVLLILSASIVNLLRSSLSVATATYELTDAQENMRVAQEFINRDLVSAGDGLKSMINLPMSQTFVQNYLDTTPIPSGTPNIVNLGILTTQNGIPVGQTVWGPNGVNVATTPVVTVRSTPALTDRQTILEVDSNFALVPLLPNKINAAGTAITILDGDYARFTAGEVYFLTSARGGTFGTLTSKVDDPGVNATLRFDVGPLDRFLMNAAAQFAVISNGGVLATSLQRMKMIHYYIDTTGRLMRRVFGVVGAGYRESAIAEHVVSVQFQYYLGTNATGVAPPPVLELTDSIQQVSVRQVEVTVVVETPHAVSKAMQPQLTSTQTTSVRNMQFRQALQPVADP